jgi:hypothetical protein
MRKSFSPQFCYEWDFPPDRTVNITEILQTARKQNSCVGGNLATGSLHDGGQVGRTAGAPRLAMHMSKGTVNRELSTLYSWLFDLHSAFIDLSCAGKDFFSGLLVLNVRRLPDFKLIQSRLTLASKIGRGDYYGFDCG